VLLDPKFLGKMVRIVFNCTAVEAFGGMVFSNNILNRKSCSRVLVHFGFGPFFTKDLGSSADYSDGIFFE